MSMYPSVGGALINAFNASLFDSYKSAGWQIMAAKLSDKWPELDLPTPEEPCFDKGRLSRVDWATQAGMAAGLLREQLSPESYALLKMRYTHDGEEVVAGNHRLWLVMTDNIQQALVDGWPCVNQALTRQGVIRKSVLRNSKRFQYMALRAIRPDIVKEPFMAADDEKQATINSQQYEVKKAVNALIKQATDQAFDVLQNAGLVSLDHH
ncbi:hypothetical protein [Sansalvadorimonas verongulae]|uniref:hypothetical protein n=1 Tax=Sansalvadorimonas verongulae TaxID=2172824 RepID=UPI0012BCA7A9|nr:hypothetical protein [Sansalvadorimonas verongulae]MTI13801.1 hypothetical protein [Sansalvadorimonas verongulae]